MAIEYFDGFEAGVGLPWTWANQPLLVTSYSRSGYAVSGNNNTIADMTLSLSATVRKYVGFAYQFRYSPIRGDTGTYMVSFLSGGTQHITVNLNSAGNIVVRLGAGNGTILATSTEVFPINQFCYVEASALIADSGGNVIVKVDGVEWINFTGDTKNAGTTTNIDAIKLGLNYWDQHYWDDLYVVNEIDDTATTGRADNTFLGDIKIAALIPNGDGAANQWMGSDGNTVQNYLLVDEVPANTTDYTASSLSGQQDLYAVGDLPATASIVYGVQVCSYMAASDAGGAGVKLLKRESGGTLSTEATRALSTTWTWVKGDLAKTKPSGGAWTPTVVNGLQVGVERS